MSSFLKVPSRRFKSSFDSMQGLRKQHSAQTYSKVMTPALGAQISLPSEVARNIRDKENQFARRNHQHSFDTSMAPGSREKQPADDRTVPCNSPKKFIADKNQVERITHLYSGSKKAAMPIMLSNVRLRIERLDE